jgi:serine/threonine-protein kinase
MAEDVFRIVGSIQAGSFRVEQPVAEGGFAVVYRAFHSGFRGHVALKCLKIPDEMSREQRARFLEKFRTEAELLFRLSAAIPEIVRPLQIHLLDMPDGRFVPFLALEWLEGEPLDRIIDRRTTEGKPPLSLREVVPLLTPIARALSRAHAFPSPAGGTVAVVHCDLKPENIFVAQAGGEQQLKLVDFGIATARTAATQAAMEDDGGMLRPSSPSSTAMAFSPQYAAPEQWAPSEFGPTGPWTDVYGLALTVVEAVIGRPALTGEVSSIRAAALDTNVRPTPQRFGFQLGQRTDRILERALAVQPRMRFQKISEFWGELEQAIGMTPSLKGTSGVWELGGDERRERERAHRELVLDQPVERLDFEIESVPSVRPKMPAAQPGELGNIIGGAPPPKLAVDLAIEHGPISTRSGRFSRPDLMSAALAPRTPLPPPPSGVTMSIPAVIGAAALVVIGILMFVFPAKLGVPPLAGAAPIAGAIGLVVRQVVTRASD